MSCLPVAILSNLPPLKKLNRLGVQVDGRKTNPKFDYFIWDLKATNQTMLVEAVTSRPSDPLKAGGNEPDYDSGGCNL